MSLKEVDLTGGESVYCINQVQIKKAFALLDGESESGSRVRRFLEEIDTNLDRNERAALSFVLIEKLLREPVGTIGR